VTTVPIRLTPRTMRYDEGRCRFAIFGESKHGRLETNQNQARWELSGLIWHGLDCFRPRLSFLGNCWLDCPDLG